MRHEGAMNFLREQNVAIRGVEKYRNASWSMTGCMNPSEGLVSHRH